MQLYWKRFRSHFPPDDAEKRRIRFRPARNGLEWTLDRVGSAASRYGFIAPGIAAIGVVAGGISAWEAHRSANAATEGLRLAQAPHIAFNVTRDSTTKLLRVSQTNVSGGLATHVRVVCVAGPTLNTVLFNVDNTARGMVPELPVGQSRQFPLTECGGYPKTEPKVAFPLLIRACYSDSFAQKVDKALDFLVHPDTLTLDDVNSAGDLTMLRFANATQVFCRNTEP